jgi:hypothetical protein
MAKVLDPLRSSEARGKVGGLVYGTCRGAKTVRSKTAPSQKRSSAQYTMRGDMQTATRAWALLDETTRGLWDDYAATHGEIDWTGQTVYLSGFNWFTRLYARLFHFFGATISNPPGVASPDAITSFDAGAVAGGLHTTWTDPGQAGTYVQLFLVGPHSAGLRAKYEKSIFNCQEPAASAGKNIDGLSAGSYTLFARVIHSTRGLVSVMVSDVGLVT